MFYHKKGQSATEYLMTYGWAILAIAIVGALLYTQVFSQRACAVEGATGFQLVDAVVVDNNEFSIDATTGDLKVLLNNQVGKNVTVTSVLKDSTSTDITDVTIADGSTATITVPAFATGTVGKCYTYQTTFVYNTSAQIDLRNSGTLNGRY
jgi:hypothetical protein